MPSPQNGPTVVEVVLVEDDVDVTDVEDDELDEDVLSHDAKSRVQLPRQVGKAPIAEPGHVAPSRSLPSHSSEGWFTMPSPQNGPSVVDVVVDVMVVVVLVGVAPPHSALHWSKTVLHSSMP